MLSVTQPPQARALQQEQARQDLHDEASHFEAIVASSDDAILSKSLDGTVLSWNPAAEQLFGYSANEMVGQSVLALFPADRIHEETGLMAAILGGERIKHFETIRLHRSGQPLHVSVSLSPILDGAGRIVGVSKIVRSIEDRARAALELDQLHAKAKHFEAIVSSSEDAILSKDLAGIVRSWNQAAQRLFGYSADEMIGQSVLVLFPPDRIGEEHDLLEVIRGGGRVEHFDTLRIRKNGSEIQISVTLSPITNEQGVVVGVSTIARDISDRVDAERAIWTHANFDALTGLANRHMLNSCAEKAFAECSRDGTQLALLYIDVDEFKNINDALGHTAGDELLVAMARRIQSVVRDEDIVARQGGDEFVVLLSGVSDTRIVDTVVARVQQQMEAPFQLGTRFIKATLSGGVALFPGHSNSWADLLRHADQALYEAKKAGRNCVRHFEPALENQAQQLRKLLAELQLALEREQLSLQYQPVVRMRDGVMVKAEALLRWQHPTLGWVSPAEFIPLAEQSGLIHEIGDFVIASAARQARRACRRWGEHFSIAFNVSPVQLKNTPDLLARWQTVLGSHPLMQLNLVAEITEGMLVEQSEATQTNLRDISRIGMGIAIDDFGTGYSSLNYLVNLNAQTLKIDQSFTSRVDTDPRTYVLCEAIVAMAHKLDMEVVAEGVETQGQWLALQRIGCDMAQGYLISRPLPREAFEAFEPHHFA